MASELAAASTTLTIRKWDADQTRFVVRKSGLLEPQAQHFDALGVEPYETLCQPDANLITLAGWALLLNALTTLPTAVPFSATLGALGVGTSTTAATAADTKLGGDTGVSSTTSYYQVCGAAPAIHATAAPANVTWTATFGSGVANFAWNEFGIVASDSFSGASITGTPSAVMLNHGVLSMGTKASGSTWQASVQISFGSPSGSGTVN